MELCRERPLIKANVRIWCWHEGLLLRHHQIAISTKFKCSKAIWTMKFIVQNSLEQSSLVDATSNTLDQSSRWTAVDSPIHSFLTFAYKSKDCYHFSPDLAVTICLQHFALIGQFPLRSSSRLVVSALISPTRSSTSPPHKLAFGGLSQCSFHELNLRTSNSLSSRFERGRRQTGTGTSPGCLPRPANVPTRSVGFLGKS